MRTLIVILVLLAAGKIAIVEWLHRSASDDVIVATYGPRALDACNRDARRKSLIADATAWRADTPIRLELGRPGSNVRVWQVDSPAWSERFRHLYLILSTASSGNQVECTFDVLTGTGVAVRL